MTLICSFPSYQFGERHPFLAKLLTPISFTLWHHDPCKWPKGSAGRGGDDSCGWFMRAHHGDPEILKRIAKRFEEDWDRIHTSESGDTIFFMGYFLPDGHRNMSAIGITLNLFIMAAGIVFESTGMDNWRKSRRWVQSNLADILLFAENPVDSIMFRPIHEHYIGSGKPDREGEIAKIASIVYGWILRETRPWWKHPRWHINHWEFQWHFIQRFKRWAFSRCCKCGKGFRWGYCPTTNNWNSTGPLWFRSEPDKFHANCNDVGVSNDAASAKTG